MNEYNILTLAFMGDSVYDLYVRHHVIKSLKAKPNALQREATIYVSAKSQSKTAQYLIDSNFLNEDELNIFKRGKNAKIHSKAKNASVMDYRMSTGFEAVLGSLYMSHQIERLEQIVIHSIEYVEQEVK